MATFSAVGVSSTQRVDTGERLAITVSGTFVAHVRVERLDGSVWVPVANISGALTGEKFFPPANPGPVRYRLNCYSYTSGTVTYSTTAAAAAALPADPLSDSHVPVPVLRVNDSSGDAVITFAPGDESANRTIAIPVLGGNVTMTLLELAQLFTAAQGFGSAADAGGVTAIGLGATLATGLRIRVIEEVVSLAAAGAKFVAMTTAIPVGAVILGVQANIDVLAVAGGTSVKVGIGDHTGTCNTYGNTSALTKNLKIDTIPASWAVLAGALTLEVCACASAAAGLGDTNFSAGSVRVRVVYLSRASLPDA